MVIETVTECARFAALRDDWEAVNAGSEAGSLFTSHDWFTAWCDWFLVPGTSLCIFLVWRKGLLLAIAPFVIRKERAGLNWLYLLGTGEVEASEVATEYADILLLPGANSEVEDALVDAIRQSDHLWDGVRLLNVRSDSLVKPLLAKALGRRALLREQVTGARYCVSLSEYPTSDAYFAGLHSTSFRQKLQVARRRMERAGGAFHVIGIESPEFPKYYNDLVRLHCERWGRKGREGVFVDPAFAGFHSDLQRLFLAHSNGSAYLAVLTLDNGPVAALYLLVYRGECHFYQSGIDAKTTPNVSPGILAHYLAIEWAIRQGFTVYDFMKGNAKKSYKQDFCSAGVRLCNYTMLRPRVSVLLKVAVLNAASRFGRLRSLLHRRYAT